MSKQRIKLIALMLFAVVSANISAAPYSAAPENRNSQTMMRSGFNVMSQGARNSQSQIISVMTAPTGSSVVLGGTIVPLREVTLAAQMPGRVDYLAGVEGEYFQAGEVIAAIDDDDLLAKREQALANLSAQSRSFQNSQVQYSKELWSPRSRNIGQMPGMGLPSMFDNFFTKPMASSMGMGNPLLDRQADLYEQGTNMRQARSQHVGALAQLRGIEASLRDSRTVAPFDAIIVKKFVEVGQTVQPGQPLFKLADSRALQLQVEVPVRLVSGLRQDMVVPVILDVGNTRIQARVAQIYPVADTNRHTVKVKFDLPDGVPGGPGMYAEVMVPDSSVPVQNLPVIPNSAVIWRGSLPAVYIVNHENENELRLIRLGEAIDKWNVAVLSGLRAGERVFAQPSPGIVSGWAEQNK